MQLSYKFRGHRWFNSFKKKCLRKEQAFRIRFYLKNYPHLLEPQFLQIKQPSW